MIPTKIKIYPAEVCTIAPILRLFFINEPSSPMKEMIAANIISGIEVPAPKTAGSTAPYDELSTMGMRVKKNSENMVGQNAMEKLTPIKNEPVLPLPPHSGRKDVKRLIQLNAKRPIRDRPIRMNRGPINLRNQEKNSGSIC